MQLTIKRINSGRLLTYTAIKSFNRNIFFLSHFIQVKVQCDNPAFLDDNRDVSEACVTRPLVEIEAIQVAVQMIMFSNCQLTSNYLYRHRETAY